MADIDHNGVSWRRIPRIAIDTARVLSQAASYLAAGWGTRAVRRPAPSERLHLLFLARYLPPSINGGVYRPVALMEEACRNGWRVTAVCQHPPENPSAAGVELRRRIPPSVRVVEWDFSQLDVSGRLSPTLDGGFTNIAVIRDTARKVMGSEKPDLVLASAPAFAGFIAAQALARHWNVPYALDYRDEWSESLFEFVRKGNSDAFWERRVLAHAGLVTFTTEAARNHQMRVFPTLRRDRTEVIPNGWDEPPPESASVPGPPMPGAPARIAFLGNVSVYDLPEFLRTLAAALELNPALSSRVEVSIVGMKVAADVAAIHGFPVPGVVKAIGQVPLSEAQRMMRDADALLYLNPERLDRSVGGKAWEYIAAGRPVLVYGEGGESEVVFRGYGPAMLVSRNDPAALATMLERIVSRPALPPVDPEFLRITSRRHRAGQHIALLERLIRAPTGT